METEFDDRKEVEQERCLRLRRSEEKYRTVIENLPQGYFEADIEGYIVFFNDSMCKQVAYPHDELKGMKFQTLVDSQYVEEISQVLNRVRETGGHMNGVVLGLKKKDGGTQQFGMSISPTRNDKGQIIGFMGIVNDITDRLVDEDQVTQSKKLEAIGSLAAGIAHEINTPTQYVKDNTTFLKESFADLAQFFEEFYALMKMLKQGAVTDDMVEKINAAVEDADIDYLLEEVPASLEQSLDGLDRIAIIVRALKEFSHPGSEAKQPADLRKIIENTVIVGRNEWKYVSEVKMDFAPDLPMVPCKGNEIAQVILNLIINAAHAIGSFKSDGPQEKGTITISTLLDGDWAEIRVRDTGGGIPKEIREKVFDPFFTTKGVGKGTGQGLSMAYSTIAGNHKGTISFDTEMGKGTTFIIRLPIDDDPKPNGTA